MVTAVLSYPLLDDLPIQLAPPWQFVNYPTLVPHLLDLYPDSNFEDVRSFIEEETRKAVRGEEYDLLMAIYNRRVLLRSEFEEIGR